ncbi:MAG: hypothetical protein A2V74_00940 [Acidobacteria bacterium RBG_16_70_10]|nr:MAG: hypothetical protein A2V74_00940 [Acidobacteria bacterium RBG_16_70_10]
MSYNGLLEPLGRSQVMAYVLGLADGHHPMRILSFEKDGPESPRWGPTASALREKGVVWSALRYHRRPAVLSTAFDVLVGTASALREVRCGVRLLHARSHVPALIAELVRLVTGVPYVFDFRGLLAEEYADSGLWKRDGLLFHLTNAFEGRFLRSAAAVVVLTKRLQRELGDAGTPATVIPCAVDLAAFRPADAGQPRPFDLVYSGSWSGRYLVDRVLQFFAAYRAVRPEARLLLLLRGSEGDGPLAEGVERRSVGPEEVPAQLRQARAGLCFLPSGRAQGAASPVKVSEYLACGLPVVSTPGVGDLDTLLPETRTGVVLHDMSPAAFEEAVRGLVRLLGDGDTAARCRALAERVFDLQGAVATYARVYQAVRSSSGVR